MQRTIFITGATGFIGRNLVEKILNSNPNDQLVLLVRSQSHKMAENRIKAGDDDKLKTVADEHDTTPIKLLTIILVGAP